MTWQDWHTVRFVQKVDRQECHGPVSHVQAHIHRRLRMAILKRLMAVIDPEAGMDVIRMRLIGEGWEWQVGARLESIPDPQQMAKALAHIDARRAALKSADYDLTHFGKSGDWRWRQTMDLPVLYGNGR
jgi:hypothetical protein